MSPSALQTRPSLVFRGATVFAILFGLLTLYSGGSVLFGPDEARTAAGAYMPFVVWFNFLAGGFYILAAIGLLLQRRWGVTLAILIAASTVLVAAVFGYFILQGAEFETRTVGAMILRSGVWVAISLAALRTTR